MNHNEFLHNVRISSSLFHTSSPDIPVAVMFTVTAPRTPTLIAIPPLPAPSRNVFRTPHGTRVVVLLLQQLFSTELATETEVFLTLLIEPVNGEADAGGTWPG